MIQDRKQKKEWIIEYLYNNDLSMTKHNNEIYIAFRDKFSKDYKHLSNEELDKLRQYDMSKYMRYMNASHNHFNILLEELVEEIKITKEKIKFWNSEDRCVTCNIYAVH